MHDDRSVYNGNFNKRWCTEISSKKLGQKQKKKKEIYKTQCVTTSEIVILKH